MDKFWNDIVKVHARSHSTMSGAGAFREGRIQTTFASLPFHFSYLPSPFRQEVARLGGQRRTLQFPNGVRGGAPAAKAFCAQKMFLVAAILYFFSVGTKMSI